MSRRNASGFRPGAASLNFGARDTQNLNRGQLPPRPTPTPTQDSTPIQHPANVGIKANANQLFHLFLGKEPDNELIRPVIHAPFVNNETEFRYNGLTGKPKVSLRDEIYQGIDEENNVNKPIVFLVSTNIPHTSIYILYNEQLYSIGYIQMDKEGGAALSSIDIPLDYRKTSRILWVGILTRDIADRLSADIDTNTKIMFDLFPESDKIRRNIKFFIPKKYGMESENWNCFKWTMHILFGNTMDPEIYQDLFNSLKMIKKTDDYGVATEQLSDLASAYISKDVDRYMDLLTSINDHEPRFPRSGGRRRIINNRIRIKKRVITTKMRKRVSKRKFTKKTRK
jgi:hypothetical protein